MTGLVLVTGGTGNLGRLVVARLVDAGRTVRVLSRSEPAATRGVELVRGDLDTGVGIEAAVSGAEIIVHCAGSATGDEVKAANLVGAVAAAGSTPHLVNISVVGADRIPVTTRMDRAMFGYFEAKRGAEVAVADSGLPYTNLRATQFHDLCLTVAESLAKLPVVPAPVGIRFQPVDADEVAARLVELALGPPAGMVADLGGPRAYLFADLVRGYLRAAGRHRAVVSVPLVGRAARALRTGANLCPDHAEGHRTWEEFLADRVRSTR